LLISGKRSWLVNRCLSVELFLIMAWVRNCMTNCIGATSLTVFFQSCGDSSSLSEWLHTTVPVGICLLVFGANTCWYLCFATHYLLAISHFCFSTYGFHFSGFISCWASGLELSPRFYPGPNSQCRLF